MTPPPVVTTPHHADAFLARLFTGCDDGVDDDRRDLAAVLALAACEVHDGLSWREASGLTHDELRALFAAVFPASGLADLLADEHTITWQPDVGEQALITLLEQAASGGCASAQWWSRIVARRCQRPNHLWQDLGLRHRGDLSALMTRVFRPLAQRNTHDMKWKRYLYRQLCLDGTAPVCTAPTCDACDDFARCFGDESGESLLARNRLNERSAFGVRRSAFPDGPTISFR